MRSNLVNVFKESLGTKEPCYATGFVSPKTTALFFDKIWLTDEEAERNKVPLSLRLIFDDEDEIIITNAYKDATCNNICYNIAVANNALEIIDIEKPGENQHSLKTNHFSSEIKGVRMGSDILEGSDSSKGSRYDSGDHQSNSCCCRRRFVLGTGEGNTQRQEIRRRSQEIQSMGFAGIGREITERNNRYSW